MYSVIFVGLFVAGWLICAYIPWFVLSLATRANAGLKYLPLCLFAGVVAGLATPLLIDDGATGLWLSFVLAAAVPAALLALRRVTLVAPSVPPVVRRPEDEPGTLMAPIGAATDPVKE
jgi:hypothetical protein